MYNLIAISSKFVTRKESLPITYFIKITKLLTAFRLDGNMMLHLCAI